MARKQDGSSMTYALQIAGVIALTAFIAMPVYLHMQKANNVGEYLDQERLDSFKSDTIELRNPEIGGGSVFAPDAPAGLAEGQRSAKYSNVGAAILTVSIQNITRLSAEDFKKIGETPFSITNTVNANMAIPSVIEIIFNNANVVSGFMGRKTTQNLTSNPQVVVTMIKNNDLAVQKFVNSTAMQGVLNNEPLMQELRKSLLIKKLAATPTVQYFIKNPQVTKQLVKNSPALSPLLQNEKLKKQLMSSPETRAAAQAVYS